MSSYPSRRDGGYPWGGTKRQPQYFNRLERTRSEVDALLGQTILLTAKWNSFPGRIDNCVGSYPSDASFFPMSGIPAMEAPAMRKWSWRMVLDFWYLWRYWKANVCPPEMCHGREYPSMKRLSSTLRVLLNYMCTGLKSKSWSGVWWFGRSIPPKFEPTDHKRSQTNSVSDRRPNS